MTGHRQLLPKRAGCPVPGGAWRFGGLPNPARRGRRPALSDRWAGQRPAVPEGLTGGRPALAGPVGPLALSLLLGAAAAQPGPDPAQAVAEYQLKAAVLVNLVKFVEWPTDAFAGPGAPLVIGVLGHDPFGRWLDEAAAGQTVAGHPVQVQRLSSTSSLAQVQVLFISRSEQERLGQLLELGQNGLKLTVSDAEGFAAQGGMVGLVLREGMVRFEVNLAVIQAAGLRLSSKVLKYATLVGPRQAQPDKS